MSFVFQKYPNILLLNQRPEIMAVKEVVATEKLHGSNFRLGFPCGMASLDDVLYGTRDTVYGDTEKFALNNMRLWFKAHPEILTPIWEVIKSYSLPEATLFGEAFGPGIHEKGVRYGEGQAPFFRTFGMMVADKFVTYDLFVEITDKMGLPRTPLVYQGPPSVEVFDSLLEKPSLTAKLNGVEDEKNLAEGIVIQSNPLFLNSLGEVLIVKHKATRFAEISKEAVAKLPRGATPADGFAAMYVTEGRVMNAVGRLKDRGVALKNDMTDMPTLLPAVLEDLNKECAAEWAALAQPEGSLRGAVSRVLGPIYRQVLAGDKA